MIECCGQCGECIHSKYRWAGYNGLNTNVANTEHLSTRENPLPMELNGEELNNVDQFKFLGSVIDTDGTIDRDVDLRLRAGWSKSKGKGRFYIA